MYNAERNEHEAWPTQSNNAVRQMARPLLILYPHLSTLVLTAVDTVQNRLNLE